MPAVQGVDGVARCGEQHVVLGHRLFGGVDPVGEQRELHLVLGVRQVVHLEPLGELADLGLAGQQRRNRDQRAQSRRNTLLELQLRKPARADELGDVAVDDRDREVGHRDGGEERQHGEFPARGSGVGRQRHRDGDHRHGRDEDRPDVTRRRRREVGPPDPLREGDAVADLLLELRPAPGNQ